MYRTSLCSAPLLLRRWHDGTDGGEEGKRKWTHFERWRKERRGYREEWNMGVGSRLEGGGGERSKNGTIKRRWRKVLGIAQGWIMWKRKKPFSIHITWPNLKALLDKISIFAVWLYLILYLLWMYVPVTANLIKEIEMLSKFSTFFIYPQHSLSDCDANQLFFARKVLRQKQDSQIFKRGSKSKFVLYDTL